ncbi:MFS transporter [Microvirga sp. W0021]|uniref:MFS transporter n=1 Tax=Hohaiivirga grylli TaxID=3133970 RepID=A0ABV0BJE7_9HYPH
MLRKVISVFASIREFSQRAAVMRPFMASAAALVAAFMTTSLLRAVTLSIADLRGIYGLTYDEGAWLTSAISVPQLLVAPVVPYLSAALGPRRIYVIPLFCLMLILIFLPFARGFPFLIAAHILVSLFLGVFLTTAVTIMFRSLHPKWWMLAMALYMFRAFGTPNFDVQMAGNYIEYDNWHWIYWHAAVLAGIAWILSFFSMPRELVNKPMLRAADWGGISMFGLALMLIYAGIDQGNRLDWFQSGYVTSCIVGGLVLLVAFVIYEEITPRPWARIGVLFSKRNLWLAIVINSVMAFTMLADILLIPNFLLTVSKLKYYQSGEVLIVVVALQIVMVPICVFMVQNLDPRLSVILGLSIVAIGILYGTQITHDWVDANFLPVAVMIAIGYPLAFLGCFAISLVANDPKRALEFTTYIQIVRVLFPALCSQIMTTYIRVQEQVHSSYLMEFISNGRRAVSDIVASKGLAGVSALVQREAYVLAYADAYWFCFWIAVLCILLCFFLKASPPNPFVYPRIKLPPQ